MDQAKSSTVAVNVQKSVGGDLTPERGISQRPMDREFQSRFTVVLLTLLTVAAIVFAGINFQKEREFQIPYDGVWWLEHNGDLIADQVQPDGPGAKAGIKSGDRLAAVNEQPVNDGAALQRQLWRAGVWSKATYSLVRQSVPVDTDVVLIPTEKSQNTWLRLIALIYLGIGLVRVAAALDRARLLALLRLLPSFVCSVFVPVHRKTQRI